MALIADNFNLGVFSALLVILTVTFYHADPENEFYVWIYKKTAKGFLLKKLSTAYLYTMYLLLPIIVLSTIFYLSQVIVLLFFIILGYSYLTAFVLMKYSSYPNVIDVKDAGLLALCLLIPPLLFIFIPIFYRKAVAQLKWYLE
jgi:hypothetical protein